MNDARKALESALVDLICDDVLPAYGISSETGRSDVELPASVSAAIDAALASGEQGWRTDMENAPKDGTRLLLAWEPFKGISEHVELGKWKGGLGWCNTYGKPFSGEPDGWALLAPFAPPSPETRT